MISLWLVGGFTLWLCQQFAIENGHRNSGFSHEKRWFSIVTLVYQRVTILKNISQWEGLSHTLWNIKNVPNRQPEMISYEYSAWWFQPQMLSPILDPSFLWFLHFVDGSSSQQTTEQVPFGAFPFFHMPDFERSGSGDTWGWLPSFWQLEGVKTIRKIAEDLRRIPPQWPHKAVIVHLRSVSAVHITCNKENWFVSVHVRKCSAARAGSYADLLIPPGTSTVRVNMKQLKHLWPMAWGQGPSKRMKHHIVWSAAQKVLVWHDQTPPSNLTKLREEKTPPCSSKKFKGETLPLSKWGKNLELKCVAWMRGDPTNSCQMGQHTFTE